MDVYKISIISSFLEIIPVNDVQIFAFPLYPYYIKEWAGGDGALIREGPCRMETFPS